MTITLTREEAQQVLNGLEELNKLSIREDAICLPAEIDDAMETLRARLSAPEPALDDIEQYRMQMAAISTAAIGYWKEGDGIHPDYDTLALRDVAKLYAKYDALYTAPAQRNWQGLTDEEKDKLVLKNVGQDCTVDPYDFIHAIEAKLREKNT